MEKTAKQGALCCAFLTKYNPGDQIKETEMGRACNLHIGFWWGNHLEDPSVDGRIILKWILEKWGGGTDWIDLAQDRDR